jgi:hypothetical protein
MYPSFQRTAVSRFALRLAVPGVLAFTAACASLPPPTSSFDAAQQAIVSAERVDAGVHAAAELGEARGKLSSARRAAEEKNMVAAEQLAQEARAEAELASARAGAAKAMAVNEDMKRSNATLVEEMQRTSGDAR